MDGINHGSAALLDPRGKLEESGLWIEKGLLQQDGEHCVCIPVQNLGCGPVNLEPGATVGRVQPVTIVTDPEMFLSKLESHQKPPPIPLSLLVPTHETQSC